MARPFTSIEERFWPKVIRSAGCWEWTGCRNRGRYGRIGKGGHSGGTEYAHRVSWMLHFGPIPEGMDVCHHCDNPPCVRPDHLFLGERLDNMADMVRKGRQNRDPKAVAERNGKVRITRSECARILAAKGTGTASAISRAFRTSPQTVTRIWDGSHWSVR